MKVLQIFSSLFAFLLLISTGLQAQPYNITFQVDMNGYAGTFTEANVNGTFNGWCGGCDPLTDPDTNGIWTTTVALPAGFHEFKFTVDGWTDQETLAAGDFCTITTGSFVNRRLTVVGDSTLPVFCWQSCYECGFVPDSGLVTFSVDMSPYSGSFTEANVNGTWNGWCGACNPLTDPDSNGVWEATLLIPGGSHEFKYTVDGWTDQENFTGSEPCVISNNGFSNRSLVVDGDSTLTTYCWNSCNDCGSTPVNANITFRVDMNQYAGTFTEVDVNGTWNGWCGACNPLTDADSNGVWEGTYAIPPGVQEYKFTVDGWTGQEIFAGGESCTVTTGGNTNRALNVSVDSTLGLVCWNSCDTCGTGPTHANITFSVDMNEYAGTFTEVDVNGTFNGWCGACAPLTDADSNGVWEGTYMIPIGVHEYKFTVDGWTGEETFVGGESCTVTTGGFTNRTMDVSVDSTLAEVCWNACVSCADLPNEGMISFAVDMQQYVGSFDTVNVNGTWNSWCGNCNPLSDPDGDNIWTGTFLVPGGNHQYKFTVDGWTDQEFFADGDPCTITLGGFTNRNLDVDGDSTLEMHCFNACSACSMPVCGKDSYEPNDVQSSAANMFGGTFGGINDRRICPPQDEDWYTFQLNTISTIRVYLEQLPENYDMALYDSKGVIGTSSNTGTTDEYIQFNNALAGSYHIRVFGIDNAWSASPYVLKINTLKPAPAGSVGSKPLPSDPFFRLDPGLAGMNLYPNPAQDQVNILILSQENEILDLTITDLYGKQVYKAGHTLSNGLNTIKLELNDLAAGTYILNARTQNEYISRKLVLQAH